MSARHTRENLARHAAAGTRPLPVNDVFWGGFVRRWPTELGLPADATPHDHFDLDWIVTIPNMDPHIRPIDIVRETPEKVVVRTGFETTLQKTFECRCQSKRTGPLTCSNSSRPSSSIHPTARGALSRGDNQIAGGGDGLERNARPWIETVRSLRDRCAVFGSMMEASECRTRLGGPMNALR